MIKNFLVLSILIPVVVSAQEVKLEKQVDDSIYSQYGPNLPKYSHFYLGEGFFVQSSEGKGSDLVYGSSRVFQAGYRIKYRISDFWAAGPEVEYCRSTYQLLQDESKTFPNTVLHKREKLLLHSINFGLFSRFNFKRRGNIMGNFLDIGGFAGWNFSASHITKDDIDVTDYLSHSEKTIRSDLDYPSDYRYGLRARLGFNRFVLMAEYRLSDFFKPGFEEYSELSKLWIGLQLGIH